MGDRDTMKVLISGEEWHASLPSIAAEGFRALGHTASISQDNFNDWRKTTSKIFERTPFRGEVERWRKSYREKVSRTFLASIERSHPDFIFVIAGVHYPRNFILELRQKYRIPIANFVVDDPSLLGPTMLYDLGGYSAVLVIDKSWMTVLEFFNPGHIHYLPHAGNTLSFRPLKLKKEVDIAFGGALALRMPNAPAGYLRAEILNVLAEAGFTIRAYASGIRETFAEFPALQKIDYYDGYKNQEELNTLYNQARIVLSIHSPQLKSGVSPRTFDAALSGSFTLVQYMPELPELYPAEVKWFKNKKELLELARYYLQHEAERESLAKRAYEITMERHTFRERAKEVLKIISS